MHRSFTACHFPLMVVVAGCKGGMTEKFSRPAEIRIMRKGGIGFPVFVEAFGCVKYFRRDS